VEPDVEAPPPRFPLFTRIYNNLGVILFIAMLIGLTVACSYIQVHLIDHVGV
jgi:hypothetical protein